MKILLAGEQWTQTGLEIKGFDYFGVNAYHEGAKWLKEALTQGGHTVDHIRSFEVPAMFPEHVADLKP